MARNVEVKARIPSVEALLPRVAAFADGGPERIAQDDTFFACPNGRLKLRAFADGAGELIFYQRADGAGPKLSDYCIVAVPEPGPLRELLTLAYGQLGRVRKVRTLFLIGNTRVHLDRVEGLGEFLELDVVLEEGQTAEQGTAVATDLLDRLGIEPVQLIEGAYLDLLRGS